MIALTPNTLPAIRRILLCLLIVFGVGALPQALAQSYVFASKFGTPGTGPGQFNHPLRIAIDPSTHNFLVTDYDNARVQEFDPSGNFLGQIGSPGSGPGKFQFPDGVAVDPVTHNVVVTDNTNSCNPCVQVFDANGNYLGGFGSPGAGNGQFSYPSGVAIDPGTGNLFIADGFGGANDRIQVFTPSGQYLYQFGSAGSGVGQLDHPDGIALNAPANRVAVADYSNNRVQLFTLSGTYVGTIGGPGSRPGQFFSPENVVFDPKTGNILVTDYGNDRVQIFDPNGTYLGFFGSTGVGPGQLSAPSGIAIDPVSGNVLVSEWRNNRVDFFAPLAPVPNALVASVLPTSRSVQIGSTATASATIINVGSTTALGCTISPTTGVPAAFSFSPLGPVSGPSNTAVNVAPGGSENFVLSFTPTAAFGPTDVTLSFACSNATAALIISGVNTLLLSGSSTPVPDVVALAGTTSGDGILNIPGINGTGAFVVATSNVGAAGTITVSADTGSANLLLAIALCQTNTQTGQCSSALASSITTTINSGASPSFAIFIGAMGRQIAFAPATNRIFVRLRDSSGAIRGSTSVALRTQ